MLFHDRFEAGQHLARKLAKYANRPDLLVLALPRGGVPVGFEVARALQGPLDIFLVRKLGVPGQEELALGAIASGGVRVLNEDILGAVEIPDEMLSTIEAKERQELQRRERDYRGDHPPPDIRGRTVILVDDGLATGSTMRAAVAALRQQHPTRIIAAVPVGSPETCAELQVVADEAVCANMPEPFLAVGLWYDDFSQTTDEEVRELLRRSQEEPAPAEEPLHAQGNI